MTLEEKQQALLDDMKDEYDSAEVGWWKDRLFDKIMRFCRLTGLRCS